MRLRTSPITLVICLEPACRQAGFGYCDLEFICYLVLVIWDLFLFADKTK